ncbi:SusC/RagA family TonB-linked outer membrane protein [Pontibacter lucknowensis]|uniref:Iron complex outermembrane recepter protein n=1 Tax=Pontibacter lucknowensis TaxID=1077936 RepID=A0A1N6ZI84_9BACT|nr:TonB-dependent receptor [Pontibacter lucknowensis]SIR26431.1 iron complex outermembrane recepter protein [Pontibacter lucknowensis]
MSNKSTKRLRSLGLAVALCCFQVPGTAQGYPGPGPNLAVNHNAGQALTGKSLKDLLSELKDSHGIQFSYQASLADDLQLIVPEQKNGVQNVDEFLGTTLASNNLAYKKVKGVYIISKARPAAATATTAVAKPRTEVRQDVTVSGRVVDENGETLPGVTVVLKGTTRGTSTNANGEFTLPVPASGGSLVFSFIGYTTQEVAIGNQATVNVTMRTDAQALQEVVVVGYGTQRKTDISGAVTQVTSEDFVQGQITTPEQLIQGKVAGVQITPNGGAPGSGSRIRIRGGASLNASNDPLIVIDGVPLENSDVSGAANPLSFLNPNDIETFNILKDASATAIYGSRASNGVIIITTKKGTAGQKLGVTFTTQHSLSKVGKTVDVLSADEFRRVVNEQGTPSQIALLGNANTDWQDQIYQTAYTTDNNLSVGGSVGMLPYRVSLGYLNQDGVLRTGEFKRGSIGVNLNPRFLDDHLTVNLNYKGAITNSKFADEGAIGAAVAMDPTQPVMSGSDQFGGYFQWLDANGRYNPLATRNPVSMLEQRDDRGEVKRHIGNVQLDYKLHFLPDLRANLNLGFDRSNSSGSTFYPATFAPEAPNNGRRTQYEQEKKNSLVDFYLNYVKDLTGINSRIDATAGYSFQEFETEIPPFTPTNAEGVPIEEDPRPRNDFYRLRSYFGRLNYVLLDRYILTATVRRDGTSRFGDEVRWGTFPALALAWRINEEAFLRNSPAVSELKLRLGVGVTGQQDIIGRSNQREYFPYLARYSPSDNTAQYQFGNQFYNLLRPEGYDADLKWEETTTYNAGIDFGFANNRVNGSLDYFFKDTRDLLALISIPAGTNLVNELVTNVGNLETRGLEAALNYVAISTDKVNWSIGINGTYQKREITNLSKIEDPNFEGYPVGGIAGGVGNNIQIRTVGYAPDVFYVYKQVYDEQGNPIEGLYADLNEDGVISEADRYRYKKPEPDFFLGFNTNLTYGNFDLGLVMRGSVGNYMYNNVYSNNGAYRSFMFPGYLTNVSPNVLETNFMNYQLFSDYYMENASFLRMENINFGYNVGRIFNEKANLRLNANIQNLFVITKYNGLDPEIASGIDNNFYPRPRVYTLGLTVNL